MKKGARSEQCSDIISWKKEQWTKQCWIKYYETKSTETKQKEEKIFLDIRVLDKIEWKNKFEDI